MIALPPGNAIEHFRGNHLTIKNYSLFMEMERIIRALAGTFIMLSLALGYFVSPYWYLFTLFVGANLFQSAFSRWCLAESILRKFGIGKG